MSKEKFGLTTQEAELSRQKHGSNELTIKDPKKFHEVLIGAFIELWTIVLIAALLIEIVSSFVYHPQWTEIFGLAVAILVVGVSGANQEWSTIQQGKKILKKAQSHIVNVYRDGQMVPLNSDELVVGDVIRIKTGDFVPVDGILLEGNVSTDQSSIDGEPEPAKKIPLGTTPRPENREELNNYVLYRGSNVVEGEALLLAEVVGDNTVQGQSGLSLQEDTKQSPSKAKLEVLAKQIGKMGFSAAGLYIGIRVIAILTGMSIANDILSGTITIQESALQIIMFAVSLIIMAVPEGLPMTTTIVAGQNAKRLMKQNVFVQSSEATETAGFTEVLATDKTGTLTTGNMQVVNFYLGDGTLYAVNSVAEGEPFEYVHDSVKNAIQLAAGLNNDAYIYDGKATGGNPTDNVLMNFLHEQKLEDFDRDTLDDDKKVLFDSANKFASVTTVDGITWTKGAAERMAERVTHYMDASGNVEVFNAQMKNDFNAMSDKMAEKAMRILALLKETDDMSIMIGAVAIRDELREGIADVVKEVQNAGVQVIMVTGDRKETAVAIAKDAGIYTSNNDIVWTHDDLDAMSDEEVKKNLRNLKVVARALPQDKKRLVKLFQEMDIVTAMTGDGANDAPALRVAEIGISLGSATATAQSAADMVLVDDSFESIVTAITYGRTMTRTIQKFLMFQLSVNVSMLILSIISMFFGIKEVFSVTTILLINLVMDSLAALAYALEPALKRYLDVPPVPRNEKILTPYMKGAIATASAVITSLSVIIMMGGLDKFAVLSNGEQRGTFLYMVFIFTVLMNSFNTRSENANLFEHIELNKRFLGIMGSIFVVNILILTVPVIGQFFNFVAMTPMQVLIALGLSFLVIPADLIRKYTLKK